MTALTVIDGCPKWCTVDHAAPAAPGCPPEPADQAGHASNPLAVALPDGRQVLEAELVLEPGGILPRLSVVLDELGLNVATLDVDEVEQLIARLQSFTMRLQRLQPHMRPQPPRRKAKPGTWKRRHKGHDARTAWRETRLYLAERDGWHCHYCRVPFDRLRGVSIDHYVPYSVWRTDLPVNLVLACEPCNQAKADRLPVTLAWLLLAEYGHLVDSAPGEVAGTAVG